MLSSAPVDLARAALRSSRSALAGRSPLDVPVDPDADTARRWAEQELTNPIYHERPNLLMRALEWVVDQLAQMQGRLSGLDARAAGTVIVVVLAVAALIALAVAGPVRRARRARRRSVDVFGDDRRTAAQLRAAAEGFASEGRWAEAVLDRFRAVLRDLEERTILDERPGRTAHEAADEAGVRLPERAPDLARAGRLFDDVCYGHSPAGEHDARWLAELDRAVADTRPVARAGSLEDVTSLAVPR